VFRFTGDQPQVHIHFAGIIQQARVAFTSIAGNGDFAGISQYIRISFEQSGTTRKGSYCRGGNNQILPYPVEGFYKQVIDFYKFKIAFYPLIRHPAVFL
jgi:hypothetical protein